MARRVKTTKFFDDEEHHYLVEFPEDGVVKVVSFEDLTPMSSSKLSIFDGHEQLPLDGAELLAKFRRIDYKAIILKFSKNKH